MSDAKKEPVKKYRIAGVEAALWKNFVVIDESTGKTAPRFSASFQKSYRKKDGSWEPTNTYFLKDVLYGLLIFVQLGLDMLNQGATLDDEEEPSNESGGGEDDSKDK